MLTSHTLNRAPPPDAGLGFAAGTTAAGVLDFGSTLGDPAEDDVWQAPSPPATGRVGAADQVALKRGRVDAVTAPGCCSWPGSGVAR